MALIDHAIQLYAGQKARENQWREMVLEQFLNSHCITVSSKLNVVVEPEQYLVLIVKE